MALPSVTGVRPKIYCKSDILQLVGESKIWFAKVTVPSCFLIQVTWPTVNWNHGRAGFA